MPKTAALKDASEAIRVMKEARANRRPRPSKAVIEARRAAKEAAKRRKIQAANREYLDEVIPRIMVVVARAAKRGYSKTTFSLPDSHSNWLLIEEALSRRGFTSECKSDGNSFHDPDWGPVEGTMSLTIRWSKPKKKSARR